MKLLAMLLIHIATWIYPCEHKNFLITPAFTGSMPFAHVVDHYTCLNCGKEWKP